VTRGDDVDGADVAFDRRSVVLWRLPRYCDDAAHAADEICLAPNATATTTVFFHDQPGAGDDGEIVDADIELNAVRFTFDDTGAPAAIDLQTVLAHEAGHAVGLDHTCYANRASAPLLDDRGEPQPYCFPVSALPPSVTAATMFNFTTPGETEKRGPTDDEQRAVCSIYAGYSGSCAGAAGDERSGCSSGLPGARGARWGALGAAVLAALALGARAWRRR
jgi:hypothetical protein